MFNLLFPDDCRVCSHPITEIARYPVCSNCLREPARIETGFACAACRTPFTTPYPLDEHGLCGLCRRGMNGFDRAFSFAFYEGTLRKLIHIYKYHGVETLARPLSAFLTAALPQDQRIDCIVPVPMHWWRRWKRGYNQSELLARELARSTGLPMVKALRRSRGTPPQAGLSNRERRLNLRGAISVTKPLQNRHVLLIDDVLTTGATASACGAVMKNAGAAQVLVLTLARVDRRYSVPGPPGRSAAMKASGG